MRIFRIWYIPFQIVLPLTYSCLPHRAKSPVTTGRIGRCGRQAALPWRRVGLPSFCLPTHLRAWPSLLS